jgi:hypothetical protein
VPYLVKPEAVERVRGILDQLLDASSDVEFATEAPHKLAYHLHNGMAASGHFADFAKYAGLAGKFKIRVRPGKIICELRSPKGALDMFKTGTAKMTLPHIIDITQIIGAVIQHKAPQMYFPDATLTPSELTLLFKWTEGNGYYILNHDDAGVTVTKEKTGLEWRPQ